MSRKRDKPSSSSRPVPYSLPKRRRPLPPDPAENLPAAKSPATVVVNGLSPDCSLLDIRSRFQIYGDISRSTMLHGGVAHITFRSKDSADAAVAASLDPSFGITLNSKQVQVMLATDPISQWREGVSREDNPDSSSFSSSKLVRAEVPLRRHGRGNKLESAIVNPRSNTGASGLDVPFKGREIVAYDDIL
ncbi:uncharacterized protein At1g27050 [Rhododendron vialii]|uniref:uncharacterized protein At1g27050 n=1 Tax=Rhododendron vialii TaxID=182163 RepID=UPI0026600279|nr:uncharacterized protein At1g27050 [Rhododendron vialii]